MKMLESVTFFRSRRPIEPLNKFASELIAKRTTAASPPRPDHALQTKSIDLGNAVTLDLVRIPKGEFLMGSPNDEPGRADNEGPRHRVVISRDFWMSKFEITQQQWQQVMGQNPSRFRGAQKPVNQISYHDARMFCEN